MQNLNKQSSNCPLSVFNYSNAAGNGSCSAKPYGKGWLFLDESLSSSLLSGRDCSSVMCFKSAFVRGIRKYIFGDKNVLFLVYTAKLCCC